MKAKYDTLDKFILFENNEELYFCDNIGFNYKFEMAENLTFAGVALVTVIITVILTISTLKKLNKQDKDLEERSNLNKSTKE